MVLKLVKSYSPILSVWEWCKNVWYSNSVLVSHPFSLFENDVKMYGTQTALLDLKCNKLFENDVKMYGTQTRQVQVWQWPLFENDVKMYGTQTLLHPQPYDCMFENDVKMYGTQTVWTCSMDAG